jgi:hypothetical protein
MFWVPQAGNIGMGVSILSFNGRVQFGLITDRALVPDPKAIVVRFEPEFEQLLYYVLLHASSDGSVPKVAEAEPVRERRRTKRKIKSAGAAARRKKNSRQRHDR